MQHLEVFVSLNVCKSLAETLIISRIRYCLVVYRQLPKYQIQQLQKTENRVNDCNGTRTHNYLVRKYLAKLATSTKWLSVRLRTKWLWVRVPLQSLKLQISRLFQARSSFKFRYLQSVDSL